MKRLDAALGATRLTSSNLAPISTLCAFVFTACQSPQAVPEEPTMQPDAAIGLPLKDVSVSPATLAFDVTAQGRRKEPRTITVQNGSASMIGPFEVSFLDDNSMSFEVVETACNAELAAQDACSISIVFAPSIVGDHIALVHIEDKNRNFLDVPIKGSSNTRGMLVPSMQQWALPALRSGEPQYTRLRFDNIGDYRVQIVSIKLQVEGNLPMGQGFNLGNLECPPVLLPKVSCSVGLGYNRALPGSDKAKLLVQYSANDSTEQLEVPLLATVQQLPALRLEPSRFDFGLVPRGASPIADFRLSAEGGDPGVTFEKFVVSLTTNRKTAAFEIASNECEGKEIATGQSCLIKVRRIASNVAEAVPCVLKIDSLSTKKPIIVAPIQSVIDGAATEGLVGHWAFDQASGSNLVESTMSFPAAPVRLAPNLYQDNFDAATDPMPTWIAGHQGSALTFVRGRFVRVPYVSAMDPISVQNAATICTWILVPPLAHVTDAPIVGSSHIKSIHETFNLEFGNWGEITFRFNPLTYGGGFRVDAKDLAFNDGKWHQLCGSFDSQILRIFFDGKLAQESTGYAVGIPPVTPMEEILIGARSQNTNSIMNFFEGSIDDVALWSRALPPEQIKRLFDNGF